MESVALIGGLVVMLLGMYFVFFCLLYTSDAADD